MKDLKFKKSQTSIKILIIVFFVFFAIMAAFHIIPLIWALINSLKTAEEYFDNNLALPKWPWQFKNYINVFSDFKYHDIYYGEMLFNSLWMLVVNVFVNVASSALLAYAIARFRFPGRDFLYTVVIFANIIPIIGSGPSQFKLMNTLNMINNPYLIWLSWAGGFDFAFIILYGNFKGISPAYSESAKMDGAGDWCVFLKIILPQAFPCIAAIAITQAIGVWNNYGTVMIYLREYPNLAYGLYIFNTESNFVENSKAIYFAASIISAIPVIVLYACSQNLILTNMTAGGLKG